MKEKNKVTVIVIIAIIIYLCGVFTIPVINNTRNVILKNKVIYKVRVITEKINLRPEINLSSEIIREVYKDEEFEVIKYYEGNSYNWYQVLYEDGQLGWLASGKNNAWVEIIKE